MHTLTPTETYKLVKDYLENMEGIICLDVKDMPKELNRNHDLTFIAFVKYVSTSRTDIVLSAIGFKLSDKLINTVIQSDFEISGYELQDNGIPAFVGIPISQAEEEDLDWIYVTPNSYQSMQPYLLHQKLEESCTVKPVTKKKKI